MESDVRRKRDKDDKNKKVKHKMDDRQKRSAIKKYKLDYCPNFTGDDLKNNYPLTEFPQLLETSISICQKCPNDSIPIPNKNDNAILNPNLIRTVIMKPDNPEPKTIEFTNKYDEFPD
ncbi:hypothetical protein PV325_011895 [Microctonus aethiopoides]|nr:hypothetical protein PV325_011895 [Microctonus aethiopoides]